MSGGHFSYSKYSFLEVADEIESLLKDYPDPETNHKFKQAASMVRATGAMLHRIDYLVCGDDGPEQFHKRWDEEGLNEVAGLYGR